MTTAEHPTPVHLPAHVAVIMDGNGRWARARNLARIWGHREGAKRVEEIVTAARELGISYLTLYSFSKENWARPKEEVDFLMDLLDQFLREKLPKMKENGVRFNVIGDSDDLPPRIVTRVASCMGETAGNSGLVLTLALSYGSRFEIARAARELARDVLAHKIALSDITPEHFQSYLFTKNLPDVDLLIRTSGEMRLSNFLLWQISYAELYVTETLWPDFNKDAFLQALSVFQERERRFGKTRPLTAEEKAQGVWKQPVRS